jgi:hypothetical protein
MRRKGSESLRGRKVVPIDTPGVTRQVCAPSWHVRKDNWRVRKDKLASSG